MKSLYTKALLSVVALAVSMGLLLFVAAGTTHYWQAWVYLGIFTGASLLTTLYLMKKDPFGWLSGALDQLAQESARYRALRHLSCIFLARLLKGLAASKDSGGSHSRPCGGRYA